MSVVPLCKPARRMSHNSTSRRIARSSCLIIRDRASAAHAMRWDDRSWSRIGSHSAAGAMPSGEAGVDWAFSSCCTCRHSVNARLRLKFRRGRLDRCAGATGLSDSSRGHPFNNYFHRTQPGGRLHGDHALGLRFLCRSLFGRPLYDSACSSMQSYRRRSDSLVRL